MKISTLDSLKRVNANTIWLKDMSVQHLLIPVFNICQIDMKIYSQVKLIVA